MTTLSVSVSQSEASVGPGNQSESGEQSVSVWGLQVWREEVSSGGWCGLLCAPETGQGLLGETGAGGERQPGPVVVTGVSHC